MIQVSKKVTVHMVINPVDFARLGSNAVVENIINKIKIGSAYTSSGAILRGLSNEEEKLFLPRVLGISPTDNSWEKETQEYWQNISLTVPPPDIDKRGGGLVLEVGFEYPTQADAEKGNQEADEEAEKYAKWDSDVAAGRTNGIKRFKESFLKRHKHGFPINLNDYIAYRYCLAYSAVALDIKYIGNSPKIKFYLSDITNERKQAHKSLTQRNTAILKFAEVIKDTDKVTAMLDVLFKEVQILKEKERKDFDVNTKEDREILLGMLANDFPIKFVEVSEDANLIAKAFINKAVSYGILRRLPNTDTIYFGDNTKIGSSLQEAVDFFSDSKNSEIRQTVEARYKVAKEGV